MRPDWYIRWRVAALLTDVVAVTTALVMFTAARFGLEAIGPSFVPAPGREFGRAPLLFAIPTWIAVFAVLRLYSPQRAQNALQEARRLVMAGFGAAVALVMLGFFVKENPARSWLVGAMLAGTLGAAIGRQTLRSAVGRLRQRGRWTTRTLVAGGAQAKALVEDLLAHPAVGRQPVATCGFGYAGLPEWPLGALAEAVRGTGCGEVLIVANDLTRSQINDAIAVADELPVQVVVLPGLDFLMLGSLQLVTVAHEPALALEGPSMRGIQASLKRAMDISLGVLLLVLTAPLLMVAALAVRIDSRGPVVLRQERMGRKGRSFSLLKLRTMHPSHDDDLARQPVDQRGFLTKQREDERVTRVGRSLRKSSLDELPQLWNVVRGDMSLVGPRPLQRWEVDLLSLPRRMIVRPGLTGLWQVSGRSDLSAEERVRLDLTYVQNWSLLLDLAILARTVPAVVGRRGAY